MPKPHEHSCWRNQHDRWWKNEQGIQQFLAAPPVDLGTERTCPACAYERGVASVVTATGISHAAIEAGVVLLMRDVCAAVLDAHKTSRGLDTLDEKITGQADNLVRIIGMLALRDANG